MKQQSMGCRSCTHRPWMTVTLYHEWMRCGATGRAQSVPKKYIQVFSLTQPLLYEI